MKKLLTILSFTALLVACKKSDDEAYTTVTKETYTVVKFENTFGEKMYADVYATAEDYLYSRNALLSFSLDPKDTLRHTFYNLNSNTYIDIYNQSKVLSNWCRWTNIAVPLKTTATPVFPIQGFNHVFRFNPLGLNSVDMYQLCNHNKYEDLRNYMIKGNEPMAVWTAIDGTDWTTKTDDERFAKLTITKDLRFVYQWKNNSVIHTDTGMAYPDLYFQYGNKYQLVLYADSNTYLLQKRDGIKMRLDNTKNSEYKMLVVE